MPNDAALIALATAMQQTVEDMAALLAQMVVVLTPPVQTIATPAALTRAIAAAAPGDTLILANSLIYLTPFTLTKSVTLQGETYASATGRMTRTDPAPLFQAGIVATVDSHRLNGLDIRQPVNVPNAIGVMGGTGAAWDRCRLLGDPVAGAHRGIEWQGANGRVTRCFIDDVFQPAQDTQAICGWDAGPGLSIDDCWLSAAGQSIMFGGADSSSAARIPSNITVTNSDLVKNPAWIGKQQCKCALELKSVINYKMDSSRMSYAGTSQGQGAYLIVATVRNQDGNAPWSCITNVEISNCTGDHASGLVNFLGSDNVHPSGALDGFNLHDSSFTLDGALGAGRMFLFDRGGAHITLKNLKAAGVNLSALGYFAGLPAPTGFIAQNLTPLPPSTYGWFIDGGVTVGGVSGGKGHAALLRLMPDATLDTTIV